MIPTFPSITVPTGRGSGYFCLVLIDCGLGAVGSLTWRFALPRRYADSGGGWPGRPALPPPARPLLQRHRHGFARAGRRPPRENGARRGKPAVARGPRQSGGREPEVSVKIRQCFGYEEIVSRLFEVTTTFLASSMPHVPKEVQPSGFRFRWVCNLQSSLGDLPRASWGSTQSLVSE